ncbi:MAG TPA: hypothetical protein VIL36_05470, partial [Acidimicrobiales bacterium]
MGRMWARAAVAAVLGTTLTGCWVQPGFDAGRSDWNPGETTLTAASVADAALQWEATVPGTPVATYGDLVYVQDGLTVTALDTATGATRWSVDLLEHDVPEDAVPAGSPVVADGGLRVPWSWFSFSGFARVDAATGTFVDADAASGTLVSDP